MTFQQRPTSSPDTARAKFAHVAAGEARAPFSAVEYLDQARRVDQLRPAFSGVLSESFERLPRQWLGVTGRTPERGPHSVRSRAPRRRMSDAGGADQRWLVAYGYALTPRLRATAQASTAFRAPSFNDLYFPGFGNPALNPERAESAELGLRYANAGARRLRLALSAPIRAT
ncbi:MAG: TonB-dependent receptor [Burkholderiaceae bacterium]|nr:TonB-dependent receptor [Burkholderiaceae bacterium]